MGETSATRAPRSRARGRSRSRRVLLGALLLATGACANYDERLQGVHSAFYNGQLGQAVSSLSELLAEEDADAGVDASVLRLELAMACQAAGRAAQAADLLREAAEDVDIIDYTTDPQQSLVAFALAPGEKPYRVSPPEWVMLHTENMLNQVLAGDMASAEIEARRTIDVLTDSTDAMQTYNNVFSWGVAGLVLERGGDWSSAQDAYRFAQGSGLERSSLPEGPTQGASAPGTILVVVQSGKVPMRREQMYVVPWGGQIFRVNIPELVPRASSFDGASVALDGDPRGDVPELYRLDEHVMQRFAEERPRLLAAALTQAGVRALASAAAGKAAEEAAKRSTKKDDEATRAAAELVGNITGSLVNLLVGEAQGTDTRSWTLLPARLGAVRLDVPPGEHTVSVVLRGGASRTVSRTLEVPPGGLVLVNVTTAIHGGYAEPPSLPPADGARWTSEISLAMSGR